MAKKKTPTTIMSREQLEASMTSRTLHWVKRQKLAATMNQKLAEIRENYEAMFAELDEHLKAIDADIEAWSTLNPDAFGDRKSLELLNGTIGFRTGQPALKPLKGVRWDDVMMCLNCRGRQFIRITEEPDKALLLANRDELGESGLAELGLRVEQAERFFIESREDKTNE